MDRLEELDIVIVGGGICGLATALALYRKGIRSVVLERSETLRVTGAAIGIFTNGWRALDVLGVGLKLRQAALPLQRLWDIDLQSGRKRQTLSCLAQKVKKIGALKENATRQDIGEALDQFVKERRMRLFWLSLQAYLSGSLLDTSSVVMKVFILVVFFVLFRNPRYHTRYDCGRL